MEGVSIVTRKGQVTIPAEVRRRLGIKKGDRVGFVIEAEVARLVPQASITERTAGMFKSSRPPLTAEELRAAAEEAWAEDAARRNAP